MDVRFILMDSDLIVVGGVAFGYSIQCDIGFALQSFQVVLNEDFLEADHPIAILLVMQIQRVLGRCELILLCIIYSKGTTNSIPAKYLLHCLRPATFVWDTSDS